MHFTQNEGVFKDVKQVTKTQTSWISWGNCQLNKQGYSVFQKLKNITPKSQMKCQNERQVGKNLLTKERLVPSSLGSGCLL